MITTLSIEILTTIEIFFFTSFLEAFQYGNAFLLWLLEGSFIWKLSELKINLSPLTRLKNPAVGRDLS